MAAAVVAASAENKIPDISVSQQQLDVLVQEFREQLGIVEPITLSIVEGNPHLVSVQRSPENKGVFLIKVEREFLSTLTEEELRAVIAHEMGHVWIFTHHPYLQTEALANQKAAQLVPRASLRKIYEKVWRIEGQKGALADFLARVE
jgi:hypothetical protein